ncbi:hypothetical protein ACSF6F_16055 [Escherichia coli]|uniref:hypothetical protein n=1 Tax=Escherichia coli TaxID=562 RepID=UPI003EEB035A
MPPVPGADAHGANTDRSTFNNIENLGMGFINYSLVPYMTRIEQRINIGLVEGIQSRVCTTQNSMPAHCCAGI